VKSAAAGLILLLLGALPRQAGDHAIPIRGGVVLSYAVKDAWFEHDVDMWLEIQATDSNGARIQTTIANPDSGRRIMSRPDILEPVTPGEFLGARMITWGTAQGDTAGTRPRTPMLASRRIFLRLKRDGRAEVKMLSFLHGERVTDTGVLTVAEGGPEMISVLIDGVPRELPTILATGTLVNVFAGAQVEQRVWFLDDSAAAWIVRSESRYPPNGTGHLILRSVETRSPDAAKKLEAALSKECRATSYGFYFRFGSAKLEAASTSTIKEVAEVLRQHPDWVVTVEGHTDSVGGAAANQQLSERRAQAVREAVIGQPEMSAGRVGASGFGPAKPIADNKTLEGRARNRRVVLVRKC
jgi:outer membrane protein OmpA-like peptidoglycan-associated protein